MNYIQKVLSHLKGSKNATKIEYELFDHLDEHQKFFEEIGYDELSAIEKAEEKMGDADILGEQFEAMENNFSLAYAFINIAQIALIPIVLVLWLVPIIYSEKFYDAYGLISTTVYLTVFSIGLYFTFKRKSIIGAIINFIAGDVLLFKINTISALITSSINKTHISNDTLLLIFDIISVVFALLFFACQVYIIIFKIKTMLYINRRYDNKILNVMKWASSIISVFLIVACAINIPSSIINFDDVRSDLNTINQRASANASSLVGCNYDKANEWVNEVFPEFQVLDSGKSEMFTYDDEYNEIRHIEYYTSYYSISSLVRINVYKSYDNELEDYYVYVNIYFGSEQFTSDPEFLNFSISDGYYVSTTAKAGQSAEKLKLYGSMVFDYVDKPELTKFYLYDDDSNVTPFEINFELKDEKLVVKSAKRTGIL